LAPTDQEQEISLFVGLLPVARQPPKILDDGLKPDLKVIGFST